MDNLTMLSIARKMWRKCINCVLSSDLLLRYPCRHMACVLSSNYLFWGYKILHVNYYTGTPMNFSLNRLLIILRRWKNNLRGLCHVKIVICSDLNLWIKEPKVTVEYNCGRRWWQWIQEWVATDHKPNRICDGCLFLANVSTLGSFVFSP